LKEITLIFNKNKKIGKSGAIDLMKSVLEIRSLETLIVDLTHCDVDSKTEDEFIGTIDKRMPDCVTKIMFDA